ncbi:MBL fold metallo-hydrolase [Granulicella sp. 5B5]|uniref:MBL fold metallo-hydrolase n=1 Tax=Granulicella sp. 5B5 TaxID=1617967 RepID=UPI0015F3F7F8|nr:MBL fold metallo-hydrolase [Granulicella sp. 5B5]QMV17484.1 MBL fold metallo-hydrolase [Granulicella sp. 5B5]
MIRETLSVGLLGCNCTILGDEVSHEAIVIDPGYDIPRILGILSKHLLSVKQIVVTHAHIDHIASAQSLKAITGAPIIYSKDDLPLVAIMDVQASWFGLAVPDVQPPDHSPKDDERISVKGIESKVIFTPGHSEGSLCLYIPSESLLLAGDTLFAGGIGRTDFPGGNMDKLMNSLHERLLPLPDKTIVVPGHGLETTIGTERRENPFLR